MAIISKFALYRIVLMFRLFFSSKFFFVVFNLDHVFKELIEWLEMFPMLKLLMPWGEWSGADLESPSDSDDGPIFWVRPGEQVCSLIIYM